jgi:hypothetical protein
MSMKGIQNINIPSENGNNIKTISDLIGLQQI